MLGRGPSPDLVWGWKGGRAASRDGPASGRAGGVGSGFFFLLGAAVSHAQSLPEANISVVVSHLLFSCSTVSRQDFIATVAFVLI